MPIIYFIFFQIHHQSAYATNLVMYPQHIPSYLVNQMPWHLPRMFAARAGNNQSTSLWIENISPSILFLELQNVFPFWA